MNQSKIGKFFSARAAMGPLLAAAALVAACGGGGGGGGGTPTFQYVSVNGVDGVRDTRTGVVWARSLGVPDPVKAFSARLPSVAEMLSLIEATDEADLRQYFGFAFNANTANFRAYDAYRVVPTGQWAVDVGGYAVRGAVSAEAAAEPTNLWYVLQPSSPAVSVPSYSKFFNRGLMTSSPNSQGVSLMWKLCAEGTVWNDPSNTCTGTPGTYNATTAQLAADAANAARFGDFDGWRLPTKQELQALLKLESSQRPLVLDPFFVTYDQAATPWARPYRTSSSSVAGTWGVHFDTGEVLPSVQPLAELHVRLVRATR